MPLLVRGFERLRDLPRDRERSSIGKAAAREALGQRRSLDQLEDESAKSVGFFEAIDRGDVWMIQRGSDARLALEAGEALRIGGECAGQDLDRDVAAELACRARGRPRPSPQNRAGRGS